MSLARSAASTSHPDFCDPLRKTGTGSCWNGARLQASLKLRPKYFSQIASNGSCAVPNSAISAKYVEVFTPLLSGNWTTQAH